jgi:2,3,4,5-tetrahydropyridine-2-carboxylate N-succinyltransferase
MTTLQERIETLFDGSPEDVDAGADAVEEAIDLLDSGELRTAEPDGAGGWRVNEWAKKAVLL